jgi:hypothetical protein
MAHDAQSVVSRVKNRPEKCRASVHVSVRPPTVVLPSQSSSMMRSSGTPHPRRWAPIPSGTTNGADWVISSARTVGRSRWS